MSDDSLSRRGFLKTAGLGIVAAAGVRSVFGADANKPADVNKPKDANAPKEENAKYMQVPKRKLGKTGVEVPMLNLGGIFDTGENQIVLRRAIDWGVTYWDTAHGYMNGNSEIGMGKFIEKNPSLRSKLFIVTKTSGATTAEEMQKALDTSLERLKTKYVDLLFFHGLGKPEQLNDELKAFAQKAKEKGQIKFYGFSTHSNMAACLTAASKLDWIDAIMLTYNFREMAKPEMNDAVEACHKAGIGLVAMKTQAKGPKAEDKNTTLDVFMQKGFTEHQAKIKAVWNDERIASVCSQMPNVAILVSNVAAALDKTKLAQADMDVLRQYAAATCSGYCGGCSEICEQASEGLPVRDMMRIAMYHDSYGNSELARQEFANLDSSVRDRMAGFDYSEAESRCPHKLAIGKIVQETMSKLA